MTTTATTTTTTEDAKPSLAESEEHEISKEYDEAVEQEATEADSSNEIKDDSESNNYVTGMALVSALGSVTLIIFLMFLDMSIIVTAIPRITSDFKSLDDIGWYGSSYIIASCALQPLTGKFYARYNVKFMFLLFIAVFELGSALCGAAQSSVILIVARAVAGLGASGLMNGGLTIIAVCAPLHRRPALLGIMMGLGQIAIVTGPLIGGALTEYTTWRWCFYINIPVGVLGALLLLLVKIPQESKREKEKLGFWSLMYQLDIMGFILFAGLAVQLLLALEWGGNSFAWNSSTTIGLFCGAGVTGIVFVLWERSVGDIAMIPGAIISKTIVWSSCLVTFFFFGCVLQLSYYLPIYFQAVKGVSPALSGVYLLPGILSQIIFAVVGGILLGKMGYYLPWAIGGLIFLIVGSGLISTFSVSAPTVEWVFYQIIAGIGRGCALQIPIVAVQNALTPEQVSVGMAVVVFSQLFGGALFLSFAELAFHNGLTSALAQYAPTVNPAVVINAGATAIRQVIPTDEVEGVLNAYTIGIDHVFYLATGCAGTCLLLCWGMGWHKVSKTKPKASEA